MLPKQSLALGRDLKNRGSILQLDQHGTVAVYMVIERKLINFHLLYNTKREHIFTAPNPAFICPENALPLFAAIH